MTTLTIYPDKNSSKPQTVTSDPAEIGRLLNEVGVRFERWKADAALPENATPEQVLAAYKTEVDRLSAEAGYKTVDVIRITPDNPKKEELRYKFIEEHVHDEDEVRFFVEGSGAFYLHLDDKVYQVACTRDDLLSVPAGTKHWFDMGPEPSFTAIRLFISPDGWVAKFTGDQISRSIPRFNEERAPELG
jgi:1,2-dihydroxy-3-keto-5-methylthiopentene dioxygenase